MKCCDMLTQFGFREKLLYLCTSEEERARKRWVFSFFLAQNNGYSTSEIENFISEIKIFLSDIEKFLDYVGVRIDDLKKFSKPKL